MAMLSAGAKGETLKQIKKSLFFPPSLTLQAEYKKILPSLRSTKDFTIDIANKLFVKKEFSIKQDFKRILIESFQSNIEDIDFIDSNAAANSINGWVAEITKDKIKNLIAPSMINEDTRLVLVNAIYFKSNWATKFNKASPTQFQVSTSSSVEVPMMRKSDTLFYASLGTLSSTMVELPYKGDRIVMQVLLPDSNFGLQDLEEKLSHVDVHELFRNEKRKRKVSIELPKFTQETTLQLNEDLKKLGLKNMFSNNADFSGITDEEGLKVSHVVQKAFIEVDEEGTVAAAATAVLLKTKSLPSKFPKFIADHPFIFYLRDKESGILLFQGRVINPLK